MLACSSLPACSASQAHGVRTVGDISIFGAQAHTVRNAVGGFPPEKVTLRRQISLQTLLDSTCSSGVGVPQTSRADDLTVIATTRLVVTVVPPVVSPRAFAIPALRREPRFMRNHGNLPRIHVLQRKRWPGSQYGIVPSASPMRGVGLLRAPHTFSRSLSAGKEAGPISPTCAASWLPTSAADPSVPFRKGFAADVATPRDDMRAHSRTVR